MEQVKKLAAINCSVEEIAEILQVGRRTIQRRFGAAINEGRANGKMSVKRKQFEVAMKGHPSMLIWLGKIMCGQRESLGFDINRAAIEQVVELMRLGMERLKNENANTRGIPRDRATPS